MTEMGEKEERAAECREAFLARLPDIRPPSVVVVDWVRSRLRVSELLAIAILSIVPFLLGLAIAWISTDAVSEYVIFWARVNLMPVMAGALIMIGFIHRRTIEAVSAAVGPIGDVAEIEAIEARLRWMAQSRYQAPFVVVLGIPTLISALVPLGIPFEGVLSVYSALYGLAVVALLLAGLWSTIALILLSRTYGRLRSVRLNLLEPLNTPGVREISELSTTWGLCLAIETVLMLTGLWAAPWEADRTSVTYTSLVWTALFTILLIVTILYPKAAIRPLLVRGKQQGLDWFQRTFRDCNVFATGRVGDGADAQAQALNLVKEYSELEIRIATAAVSPLNLSTIAKFVGAVLLPPIVFLSQNPDWLEDIQGWIAGLFS